MPSRSEQRLPGSGSRRFNLLRASCHLQDPRKAVHPKYVEPSPAIPRWPCLQESSCPLAIFCLHKITVPYWQCPLPAAKFLPVGEGRKALCSGGFIASSSPPWGAGSTTSFLHMLRLRIPWQDRAARQALTPALWMASGEVCDSFNQQEAADPSSLINRFSYCCLYPPLSFLFHLDLGA